jgi:hypothetical protein
MGAGDKPNKVKVTKAPKIREISKAERGLRFRPVFGKTGPKRKPSFLPGHNAPKGGKEGYNILSQLI